MNRRDFLKFLGGTAAVAAVAPNALFAEQAYPVTSPCPASFGTAIAPTIPVQSPGFIVVQPGMSIQQAIDALPEAGGTVYVKSGTHIVNEAIFFPEGITLVAEGNLTISGCTFRAKPRKDAPMVFLMNEEENVEIIENVFYGDASSPMQSWFEIPIGDHLAALRGKMERLYLKMKQLVT
jgi:Endopolygalacturonase